MVNKTNFSLFGVAVLATMSGFSDVAFANEVDPLAVNPEASVADQEAAQSSARELFESKYGYVRADGVRTYFVPSEVGATNAISVTVDGIDLLLFQFGAFDASASAENEVYEENNRLVAKLLGITGDYYLEELDELVKQGAILTKPRGRSYGAMVMYRRADGTLVQGYVPIDRFDPRFVKQEAPQEQTDWVAGDSKTRLSVEGGVSTRDGINAGVGIRNVADSFKPDHFRRLFKSARFGLDQDGVNLYGGLGVTTSYVKGLSEVTNHKGIGIYFDGDISAGVEYRTSSIDKLTLKQKEFIAHLGVGSSGVNAYVSKDVSDNLKLSARVGSIGTDSFGIPIPGAGQLSLTVIGDDSHFAIDRKRGVLIAQTGANGDPVLSVNLVTVAGVVPIIPFIFPGEGAYPVRVIELPEKYATQTKVQNIADKVKDTTYRYFPDAKERNEKLIERITQEHGGLINMPDRNATLWTIPSKYWAREEFRLVVEGFESLTGVDVLNENFEPTITNQQALDIMFEIFEASNPEIFRDATSAEDRKALKEFLQFNAKDHPIPHADQLMETEGVETSIRDPFVGKFQNRPKLDHKHTVLLGADGSEYAVSPGSLTLRVYNEPLDLGRNNQRQTYKDVSYVYFRPGVLSSNADVVSQMRQQYQQRDLAVLEQNSIALTRLTDAAYAHRHQSPQEIEAIQLAQQEEANRLEGLRYWHRVPEGQSVKDFISEVLMVDLQNEVGTPVEVVADAQPEVESTPDADELAEVPAVLELVEEVVEAPVAEAKEATPEVVAVVEQAPVIIPEVVEQAQEVVAVEAEIIEAEIVAVDTVVPTAGVTAQPSLLDQTDLEFFADESDLALDDMPTLADDSLENSVAAAETTQPVVEEYQPLKPLFERGSEPALLDNDVVRSVLGTPVSE